MEKVLEDTVKRSEEWEFREENREYRVFWDWEFGRMKLVRGVDVVGKDGGNRTWGIG